MVDLQSQYSKLKTEIDDRIQSTINSAAFIHGPEVKIFEDGLSTYLDGAHIISCANGTDALQIALMALELEQGDEVIVPSFTFVASVEVIALLGLKPIVVDVDDKTFLMKLDDIQDSLSPRTRAIIPVHLFGQCVDMKSLLALAKTRDLIVIEDNAQSIGAKCNMGDNQMQMSGTIGQIGNGQSQRAHARGVDAELPEDGRRGYGHGLAGERRFQAGERPQGHLGGRYRSAGSLVARQRGQVISRLAKR